MSQQFQTSAGAIDWQAILQIIMQILSLFQKDPVQARAELKAQGCDDETCDLCELTCAALCASGQAFHAALLAHQAASEKHP